MPVSVETTFPLSSLGEVGRTFVRRQEPFKAHEVLRSDRKVGTEPQRAFEQFLRRLADDNDGAIPVYLKFPDLPHPMRLDQGRVGHAVANVVLAPLVNGSSGFVEVLRLAQTD